MGNRPAAIQRLDLVTGARTAYIKAPPADWAVLVRGLAGFPDGPSASGDLIELSGVAVAP